MQSVFHQIYTNLVLFIHSEQSTNLPLNFEPNELIYNTAEKTKIQFAINLNYTLAMSKFTMVLLIFGFNIISSSNRLPYCIFEKSCMESGLTSLLKVSLLFSFQYILYVNTV